MRTNRGLWKRRAAEVAAEFVKDGMTVGLGSGSTMVKVADCLAMKEPKAVFIPASSMIERIVRKLGLKLGTLDTYGEVNLVVDGADEVDPDFNLIKGRGGAHTREKILARAAERVVIVVDRTKLVKKIGERAPVPVEVIPFAARRVMAELKKLGGRPKLRKNRLGKPYITDNGNHIIDAKFPEISNPAALERKINNTPGVVENGIFVGLVDTVVVGYEGGHTILRSERDFSKFMKTRVDG